MDSIMVLVMKINIQFFEVSSLIEQKSEKRLKIDTKSKCVEKRGALNMKEMKTLRKRKKIAAFDEPRSCSVRD